MPQVEEDWLIVFRTLADRAMVTEPGYIIPKLADAVRQLLADDRLRTDLPWSWTPPAEPGPDVRRLRPVERYAGDNSIWYDREPDGSGWRLVAASASSIRTASATSTRARLMRP